MERCKHLTLKFLTILVVNWIFLFAPSTLDAQTYIDTDVAYSRALKTMTRVKLKSDHHFTIENERLEAVNYNGAHIAYLARLSPNGFIVVSPFEQEQKPMAISTDSSFPKLDDPAYASTMDLLYRIYLGDRIAINSNPSQSWRDPLETVELGPFVSTLFGQVNCHDADGQIINSSNLYTPNNYAAGCVAVSLATMMDYYRWPLVGKGEHTAYDNWGLSRGSYYADFEHTSYDWDLIADRYNYQNTSLAEREALSELIFHAAIALDMDFESNGSGSNVNRIPDIGSNYFRFSAKHASATSPIFWRTVDSCIVNEVPVIFAISASGNLIGHSVVCDGVRIEDDIPTFYHLNMGWWGSSNGWYRVRSDFYVSGYNVIESGVINYVPEPQMLTPELAAESDSIEVQWIFSDVITPEAYELQYKIDDDSWQSLGNNIQQNVLMFPIDEVQRSAAFRVKAKYMGQWPSDSWSNVGEFQIVSTSEPFAVNKLKLYPNPFSDNIFLQSTGDISTQGLYAVYALHENRWILKDQKLNNNLQISTQNWPRGTYVFYLIDDGKKYYATIIKP